MTGGKYDLSQLYSPQDKSIQGTPEQARVETQAKMDQQFKPESIKKVDEKLLQLNDNIVRVSRDWNDSKKILQDNLSHKTLLEDKWNDPNVSNEEKILIQSIYPKVVDDSKNAESIVNQNREKAIELQKAKSTLNKVYDVQEKLDMDVNDDALKASGNFLSHVYNAVPETVSGAGALAKSVGSVFFKENPLYQIVGDAIKGMGDNLKSETNEKYDDKHYISSTIGDIVGSIAVSAIPGGMASKAGKAAQMITGATSATMQMADGIHEKAKAVGLSDKDAGVMTLAIAPVAGLLEVWGATNIIDNVAGKKALNELMDYSIKNLAGKTITKELVYNTVSDGFKEAGKKYGISGLKSALEEGVTEGLQGELEAGAENLYDIAKGEEKYGTKFFSTETQLDVAKQAALGAVAGTAFGVISGINTKESLYKQAIELDSNPEKKSKFLDMIDTEVKAGHITEEQANNITNTISSIVEMDKTIPPIVSDENKRIEAIGLISERNNLSKENNNLQNEMQGYDLTMISPQQELIAKNNERINAINSDLTLISKYAERVSMDRKSISSKEEINNQLNIKENAIQERPTEEEIPLIVKSGEDISGSSEGVRPGEQGDKVAKEGEKENVVIAPIEPYVKGSKDYHKGNTAESKLNDLPENERPQEHEIQTFIAENSENPLELATEYLKINELDRKDKTNYKDQIIHDANIKLTREQFADIADASQRTKKIDEKFLREKGVNFDTMLESINDANPEMKITFDDLADYIIRQGQKEFTPKSTPIKTKFKNRFSDLTGGRDLTPSLAKSIISSELNRKIKNHENALNKEFFDRAAAESEFRAAIESGEITINEYGDIRPGEKSVNDGGKAVNNVGGGRKIPEGEKSVKIDLVEVVSKKSLKEVAKEGSKETGISKEMRDKQLDELGLPKSDPIDIDKSKHTEKYLNEEANRLVDSKEMNPVKLAEEILDGAVEVDDLKNIVLERGAIDLANDIAKSQKEKSKAASVGDLAAAEVATDNLMESLANLNKIHNALSKGLTKAARTLRSAQQTMQEDYSIGNLYTRFKKANLDKQLPNAILERLNNYAIQIAELNTKIKEQEDLLKQNTESIQDLKVKKVSPEKIVKIREKRAKLFDEWKAIRSSKDGPVKQGLPIGDEDVKFAAKIALSYLEEGIVTTMEVSKQLKSDVKKYLGVKLTDEELYKILDSEVDGKKVVENFENTGVVSNKLSLSDLAKKAEKRMSEIGKDAPVREKKSEEQKIRERALIKNTNKALNDLRIAREKIKRKVNNEEAALEYVNKTKYTKFKEGFVNVLNIPRSLMASFDFSAPLRQGLVATTAHPISASKATVEMFKQAFSQKNFDDWLINYKLTDDYKLAHNSELYIADPSNLHNNLQGREEAFMSNLAERIPVVGLGIKASERAYVGYLNKLRSDVFKNGADNLMDQGFTFEKDPEKFKAWADFVNNSTGRGKLPGKKLEDAAPVLNSLLFSPRLIASRINLLNLVYYAKMPKEVRIKAVADMAKFIGLATSVLALYSLAGADVEDDPRSSDFGKIRFGNTRYDILGGFQQYIRVASQVITGQKKSTATGKVVDLDPKKFPYQSPGDVLLTFGRNKLSPAAGIATDFLTKKDAVGLPITVKNELYTHLTPLQLQGAIDAYKEGGMPKVASTMIPSMFGVGVQIYSSKKTKQALEKVKREESKSN